MEERGVGVDSAALGTNATAFVPGGLETEGGMVSSPSQAGAAFVENTVGAADVASADVGAVEQAVGQEQARGGASVDAQEEGAPSKPLVTRKQAEEEKEEEEKQEGEKEEQEEAQEQGEEKEKEEGEERQKEKEEKVASSESEMAPTEEEWHGESERSPAKSLTTVYSREWQVRHISNDSINTWCLVWKIIAAACLLYTSPSPRD